MSGLSHDYWKFEDDFIGGGTFVATAGLDPWVITDASSAGTPTYTRLDHGETAGAFRPGVAALAFDSQTEAQNLCLSFGDKLAFDINKVKGYECSLRYVGGAGSAIDSATSIAFGLTGDRADAIDSIAIAAIFRLIGNTTLLTESDDAVNNNDDIATGVTVSDSNWRRFRIDFSNLSSVKFFASDVNDNLFRVSKTTTFDMSNYAAGLQPFFQIQKTSDNNVDALQIDYVKVWGVR
jgi:hypothetical protein